MHSSRTLGACTALLAFAETAVAQKYSFRHYGAAEGIQNLVILSLAQDGAGYIWAGSEGGLYRYDGTRFRLMSSGEGLTCASEVHTLHVGSDGALWANACSQISSTGCSPQPVGTGVRSSFGVPVSWKCSHTIWTK